MWSLSVGTDAIRACEVAASKMRLGGNTTLGGACVKIGKRGSGLCLIVIIRVCVTLTVSGTNELKHRQFQSQ